MDLDDILAQEALVNRKLDELKHRQKELLQKGGHHLESIRDLKEPVDACVQAKIRREAAIARNSELLQELDMSAAKLHTKRLCPLNDKLKELKNQFIRSQMRQ